MNSSTYTRTVALVAAAATAALTMSAGTAIAAGAGAECPAAQAFTYDTGGLPTVGGPVNDPLWPQQWGMRQIKAPAAWARGFDGRGVTVAVADTGVDLHQPDLKDRLLPGVDLLEKTAADCAPGPQDDHGHGTHVAGIIAATANNGIGVTGVAPRARLLPIKACDAGGSCPEEAEAASIRLAVDRGAQVINASWGADQSTEYQPVGPTDPKLLTDAVAYAWSKGAVVVAAAGNDTRPLCMMPAALPHVICVAATGREGLPASYSNLPFDTDDVVGVRAPGGEIVGNLKESRGTPLCDEAIWSTFWPGAPTACGTAYDTYAGTSMATPHVTGLVALLFQAGLTNVQIVERIKEMSSNHGSYDPVMGYGLIDADAATKGLRPRR